MSKFQLYIWQDTDFVSAQPLFPDKMPAGSGADFNNSFSRAKNRLPTTITVTNSDPRTIVLSEEFESGGTHFPPGSGIAPAYVVKSADGSNTTFIVGHIDHKDGSGCLKIILTSAEIPSARCFVLQQSSYAPIRPQVQNCFARGTLIETPHGALPVEQLEDGDELMTRDGSTQLIFSAGSRRLSGIELVVNPDLQPVRIMAGALTGGRPGQDLIVSKEHRLLVDDWRAAYLFGEDEILVPAESLVNTRNVVVECPAGGIEYFHLLMEENSLVCANGLWAETLLPEQADQVLDMTSCSYDGRSILPALPHHSAPSIAA